MPNIIVSPLIRPRTPTGTTLWVTDKVAELLLDDSSITDVTKRKLAYRKARGMCDAGFRLHMPDAVKREHGKTYRVRIDQYRIVGFFDQDYHNFIALDFFVKKTQRNDSRMTAIYQKVDAIREAGTWTKSK
jgi:mRNA-degrading endonuclease RelE of RelBE toxin-antitoxin system